MMRIGLVTYWTSYLSELRRLRSLRNLLYPGGNQCSLRSFESQIGTRRPQVRIQPSIGNLVYRVLVISSLIGIVSVIGCGSYNSVSTTATYTVGGTVSGLTGTGLVLQDNSGNNLAVSTNGSFTFTVALASGAAYKVTVFS